MSGVGGSAAAGGSANAPLAGEGTLGGACRNDADCDAPLVCASADGALLGGQGAAGGVCTLPCGDSSVCEPYDAEAICVGFGVLRPLAGYCMRGCEKGGGVVFDPAKCHGRPELSCTTIVGGDKPGAACLPTCNSDADCGDGRYCDGGSGTCASTAPSGKPGGAKCSAQGDTGECQGYCVGEEIDGVPYTWSCMDQCTVGARPACSWDGQGPADEACIVTFVSGGAPGAGDSGFCGQLCDCNDDCSNPDVICLPVPGLAAVYGRDGACIAQPGSAGVSCL